MAELLEYLKQDYPEALLNFASKTLAWIRPSNDASDMECEFASSEESFSGSEFESRGSDSEEDAAGFQPLVSRKKRAKASLIAPGDATEGSPRAASPRSPTP
ncbi:unnamed protein product [Danaus chrysippus]|uniref:(African queen) hypothetical protein n=1 Tax=Danaus chrysippus TaxID=151541 RepID=A0A8J2W8Q1_9NEOP|nr:unnamed protein product [Danaus chrysippus]